MKTILVDAINTLIIKDKGIDEEMKKILDQYPNRKIIVTNANDEQMTVYGLANLPYEVFTLKHNPDKSDPEYYKILLEHFGLAAKDVIYFEHNEEAVKSAQAMGINALHYDKDNRDLKVLKKFIDDGLLM